MEQSSQSKIFKYSIIGLLLVAVLVVIHVYFLKEKPAPPPPLQPFAGIEIDLDLLQSAELEALIPFDKIQPPIEVGRDTPFSPY